MSADPKVLFATAEFAPVVKVGGLSEASQGLVSCLRSLDLNIDVVIPDYGMIPLVESRRFRLDGLPDWVPTTTVRVGVAEGAGELILVNFEGIERQHPYVDPATATGWPDNDFRFMAFSAVVARLADYLDVDILHCNDWHTAAALGWLHRSRKSVLTVHNLAYQGHADPAWLHRFDDHAEAFHEQGSYNPLAGGMSIADRIVMVSRTYAREALRVDGGFGLHHRLVARGDDLSGIRNGIDPGLWDPAEDPLLPANFSADDLGGKELCRKELSARAELPVGKGPIIGVVARFVHQKGIDLALDLAPYLGGVPAQLVIIGSGSPELTRHAQDIADTYPNVVSVFPGYDERLAHLVVAGSDLLLVPSRFEPCGLTQMQAMSCGTIPVVTDVGGLRDTVIDTDKTPRAGTGFVADSPTPLSLLDAIHRAARGWGNPRRRTAVQRRGMTADWSWVIPSQSYIALYEELLAEY